LHTVNFLTLVTEFAAINEVSAAFGSSPYIGVPFMAAALSLPLPAGGPNGDRRIELFVRQIPGNFIRSPCKSAINA
jgi:hypothetical protein